MLNCRIKVLESYLTESKARCEYLEEQHNEETKSCHLMEVCTPSMHALLVFVYICHSV